MDVGMIGLGQMGHGMAANLIKAGHRVTVWNRSAGKDDDLVEAGAVRARTPAAAARGEAVLTMLADDRALEAVVFGSDGIADSPALHVGCSTISLALAERLGERRNYISAPVFGRPPAAAAGKLFIVAAGEPALVERAEPLFEAIGQRVFRVGERPRQANVVKLSGNFMIMAAVEAMAEAMTLAEKHGVARADLLEVLTGTIFGAPVYQNYGRMLVEDEFTPAGFPAPLGLKDMTLAAEAATAARVPMPVLAVVRDQLLDTLANEGEGVDWGAIALAVRRGARLG